MNKIASSIPEGFRFAYEQSIRAGRIYHQWSLVNEAGGVHVSAWIDSFEAEKYGVTRWMGGIEMHSPKKLYESGSDKPDHEHCWLLGGPCWHDGSSLQFSEQLADDMPDDGVMGEYQHERVLSVLRHRHRIWLTEREEA